MLKFSGSLIVQEEDRNYYISFNQVCRLKFKPKHEERLKEFLNSKKSNKWIQKILITATEDGGDENQKKKFGKLKTKEMMENKRKIVVIKKEIE